MSKTAHDDTLIIVPKFSGAIDHIHLYVHSRRAAAEWYSATLGFEIVAKLQFWAEDTGNGPLTISDASGAIHLALFRSETVRPASFALGASANEYLAWKEFLHARSVHVREMDHQMSWSIYLCDPYENQIEITSYDHEEIAQRSQKLNK